MNSFKIIAIVFGAFYIFAWGVFIYNVFFAARGYEDEDGFHIDEDV